MKDTDAYRQRVESEGRLIGCTAPCAETKGAWWQVYAFEGTIVALGMEYIGGISLLGTVSRHATELVLNKLPLYCEDPNVARWAIENEADIRTHPTCLAGRS